MTDLTIAIALIILLLLGVKLKAALKVIYEFSINYFFSY